MDPAEAHEERMRERPEPAELDEILTHGQWVRRLARRLLDDPSLVDDVVQETWMVAMARRPHGGERLRGWLGSVVRNVVRQTRRADGRRRRREQRMARPEADEPRRDLVAEADLHARVTRAVLGLAEPYRSTLLMRYFEELTPEQIAQREGCSGSTVRNRQRRALQLLRDGLDGEFDGDRRAWSQALIPLAIAGMGEPSSAAVALTLAPWKEALIMTTTTKIAAAVLVVALSGVTWWALPGGREAAVEEPVVVSASLPIAPGDGAPEALAGEVKPLTATRAPEVSAEPADSEPSADERPGDPARFSGRILDPAGQALANARVTYLPDSHTLVAWGVPLNLQSWKLHELDLPSVRTDVDGLFVLESAYVVARFSERQVSRMMNPLSDPELIVSGDGLAWTSFVLSGYAGGDLQVPDIVVVPGGLVRGRVIDSRRAPIADVEVTGLLLAREWSETSEDVGQKGHASRFLQTRTDKDGHWQITGTSRGHGRLRFHHPDFLANQPEGFDMADGEVIDRGDMLLEDGATIAGRIQDGDGQPIEGARVFANGMDLTHFDRGTDTILWEVGKTGGFLTDALGAFEIRALEGGTQTVWVDPPGHEPQRVVGVRLGRRDLVVEVSLQAQMTVQVLDAGTGQPVEDPSLTATRGLGLTEWEPRRLVVHDRGREATGDRFLVERLGRVSTQLTASAPGYATAHGDAPGLEPGASGRHVMRLVAESVLAGRVVSPKGVVVSGATVSLTRAAEGEQASDDEPPEAETRTTDETGRFLFAGLGAGTYTLGARAERHAAALEQTLALTKAERNEDVNLELQPTGTLRGVIYGLDGQLAMGQGVYVWNGHRGNTGLSMSTRTDRNGRFVLDSLAPGAYRVNIYPSVMLDVTIAVGDTTQVELFMRARPRFTGRVLDPRTGAGIAGARVAMGHFRTQDGVRHWSRGNTLTTDEDGRYDIVEGRTGPYQLVATLPGNVASVPVDVDAEWGDELEIDIVMGTGRIEGRVVASHGKALEDARISVKSAFGTSGVVACEPDGSFVLDHLTAGAHRIVPWARDALAGEPVEVTLTEGQTRDGLLLSMSAGASVECTIRLPNGEPIADKTDVQLIPGGGGREGWGRTEGGRASFTALAPGRYELVVGDLANARYLDSDVFVRWREPITLVEGEHRSLQITVDH